MKGSKKSYLRIVLLLLVFFMNAGLIRGVFLFDKQSERNTTEFTVTVAGMKKYEGVDNNKLMIFTKEYDNCFVLNTNIESINIIEEKLSDKEIVQVRIRKIEKKNLNKGSNLNCVSLTREGEELFSINDYNNHVKQITPFLWKAVIFIEVVQVAIVIFLIFKKKGVHDAY